jgi:maltose O-acetyltransferase
MSDQNPNAPTPGQRLLNAFLELLPVRLAKISAKGLHCELGVVVKTPLRLALGKGVVLQRRSILHCGGKQWSDYKGGIALGNGVVVGPGCILYGAGTIRVGDYTHFGPGSMVMSQSGDSQSQTRLSTTIGHIVEPVVLGKGVWVGAGAVILGGTVLGDNCNISPNSVVSGKYPAGTTLIGNPARVVRMRSEQ